MFFFGTSLHQAAKMVGFTTWLCACAADPRLSSVSPSEMPPGAKHSGCERKIDLTKRSLPGLRTNECHSEFEWPEEVYLAI